MDAPPQQLDGMETGLVAADLTPAVSKKRRRHGAGSASGSGSGSDSGADLPRKVRAVHDDEAMRKTMQWERLMALQYSSGVPAGESCGGACITTGGKAHALCTDFPSVGRVNWPAIIYPDTHSGGVSETLSSSTPLAGWVHAKMDQLLDMVVAIPYRNTGLRDLCVSIIDAGVPVTPVGQWRWCPLRARTIRRQKPPAFKKVLAGAPCARNMLAGRNHCVCATMEAMRRAHIVAADLGENVFHALRAFQLRSPKKCYECYKIFVQTVARFVFDVENRTRVRTDVYWLEDACLRTHPRLGTFEYKAALVDAVLEALPTKAECRADHS